MLAQGIFALTIQVSVSTFESATILTERRQHILRVLKSLNFGRVHSGCARSLGAYVSFSVSCDILMLICVLVHGKVARHGRGFWFWYLLSGEAVFQCEDKCLEVFHVLYCLCWLPSSKPFFVT